MKENNNTGVEKDACLNCNALVVCEDLSVVCRLEDQGCIDLCPKGEAGIKSRIAAEKARLQRLQSTLGKLIKACGDCPEASELGCGGCNQTTDEEVVYMDYRGYQNHKSVEVPITLVKMPRFQGTQKTIYSKDFPQPLVCREFCENNRACHLRQNGFTDLCQHHCKMGILVRPVDPIWKARFDKAKQEELKAKMKFANSSIRGIVPEIALAHERTEDSTFGAYSSIDFLDAFDDPGEDELGYSMDTGMPITEKSQGGEFHTLMYRTTYKDVRMFVGFDTHRVEKAYVEVQPEWVFHIPYGKFILTHKQAVRITSYMEHTPIYRWVRIPTLHPVGCYLKAPKVVKSVTIVTRKERAFYSDRREVERQEHHRLGVLIAQDGIDAQKQVAVTAAC